MADVGACAARPPLGRAVPAARARPASSAPRVAHAESAAGAESAADSPLFLGLDFGTSGARATVVDVAGAVVADVRRGYNGGSAGQPDHVVVWETALWQLLEALAPSVRCRLASIAFDGTSATALLVDREGGAVVRPPKLYNEAQDAEAVARAKAMAPPTHTATASTSTLCKLLAWQAQGWPQGAEGARLGLLHQADWLASLLHGRRDVSDWHNALKLGYDPGQEAWPAWLTQQPFAGALPPVVLAPGSPVASILPQVAAQHGLPPNCLVCGGTTDSIAAFLAARVAAPGEAVTSLGSTLAVKVLSRARVDDAAYGVYSHRLGEDWLVGGASNTGGAVLRAHFTDEQLTRLSTSIDPAQPSGLDYYPLTKPGERFPVNDPQLQPRLEPRPEDDAQFLHGILEGIAAIEARAYALLRDLGASPLTKVYTAGGGAANTTWTAIRTARLAVPVIASAQTEASYGSALLARQGYDMAQAGVPMAPDAEQT